LPSRTREKERRVSRTRARTRRQASPAAGQQADPRLAWYTGLALMAAFELMDWPVAIAIAIGHEIAHRARTRALRELGQGIEAG